MKLSVSVKRLITEDWAKCFPALGIYKPMWLLRRVGPLVSGICLERDSGNDSYRPTCHVHNLAKEFPAVSLTLADPLRTVKTGASQTIQAAFHQQRFSDAAMRLQQQAQIPLSGPVHLEDCVRTYRANMDEPLWQYAWYLFDDVITLLIWCEQTQRAEAALFEFGMKMRNWPSKLHPPGGLEVWAAICQGWIDNPHQVRETVESQTKTHGLEHLPYVEIQR